MIIEKGYAKINLGLEVVKRRSDNFHDLSMIMTTINLYDELYFEDAEDGVCSIDYDQTMNINIKDDLIYKAYTRLKDQYGLAKGLKVRVVKRIPTGAGLGGGSADAAATLRALNKLWQLDLTLEELAKIGLDIGSDVPFCIYNKTARVSGRGEIIDFIPECPYLNLILVFPGFKSSTATVFSSFKVHRKNKGMIDNLEEALKQNEIKAISSSIFNDLEEGKDRQTVTRIKSILLESGALGAAMTGSGSTIYGICYSKRHAEKVKNNFLMLNNKVNPRESRRFEVLIATTRSFKKPKIMHYDAKFKSRFSRNINNIVTQTKAYAMVRLFYRRDINDHQAVAFPLSAYDHIYIKQNNKKTMRLYFDGFQKFKYLNTELASLQKQLGYGLDIHIRRLVPNNINIISKENYLSAIVSSLDAFGEDTDKLFNLYKKNNKVFKKHLPFFFDSNAKTTNVFSTKNKGFVVLVPFDIFNYRPPRYTRQADNDPEKLNTFLNHVKSHNFIGIAQNIYNGVEDFERRKIEQIKGFNVYERIKNISKKNKAAGSMIAVGGSCAIVLFASKGNALRFKREIVRSLSMDGIITNVLV